MTEAYRQEKSVSTLIESNVDAKNRVTITIHPTAGSFDGFVKDKKTELRINVTEKPKKLTARINNKKVKLTEVSTAAELLNGENVFWYEETPNLNKFATKGSEFEKVVITRNPLLHIKLGSTDITANRIELDVEGFRFEPADRKHRNSVCTTKRSSKRAEQRSIYPATDLGQSTQCRLL